MLLNGTTKRLDTFIDIPLEIGLPHFVSDDRADVDGPLIGNFKLVLQSVVCHRGRSIHSGHYIALVRANSHERPGTSHTNNDENSQTWLRFDDLQNPRVKEVDIKKALRDESPYLLFYQVQPIDEELASRGDPPAYDETQTELPSMDLSRETLDSATESVYSDERHGRTSMSSNRRGSVTFDGVDGSSRSISRGRPQSPTPDEQKTSFLSVSRRGSRIWMSGGSKSRQASPSGENRLSLTFSRLTGRGSKDKLVSTDFAAPEETVIVVDEVPSVENGQRSQSPSKEKKDTGITRSKSKKEKKDRFRGKSRDPGENSEKAKHKDKSRPDRECVMM
jgi:hypothetical protein